MVLGLVFTAGDDGMECVEYTEVGCLLCEQSEHPGHPADPWSVRLETILGLWVLTGSCMTWGAMLREKKREG